MQDQHHPLQGVGYRPTPFDQLSQVALSHSPNNLDPIASTSTRIRPASNGDSEDQFTPPDINSRPTKKARKSGSVHGGVPEGDEGKKRSKQTLSCSECKRRKIKCDRTQPCSACVKRGAPQDCSWEDAKIEPERQPFALAEDIDELRVRLKLLETFINKLPPSLKTQSFAEMGVTNLGPVKRAIEDDTMGQGDQMFENLARLDPGTGCPFHREAQSGREQQPKDNLELLENALMLVCAMPDRGVNELTDALTCIVAPRPTFVDVSSATKLGLDLCYSEEEFQAERRRTLDRIFRVFPTKEEASEMLEKYQLGFNWMFAVAHLPSLYAEHKRFWEMVEAGRRDEVDPAWLANYALVLALSCDETHHPPGTRLPGDERDQPEYIAKQYTKAQNLYAASQKLLLLADPYGRPQVRVIQYTALVSGWTVVAAVDGEDWARYSTWLALAIRIGHALNLHRLTDDPENMPGDDPAWPPGKNSVKREGALRLWSQLTFFDHLAAPHRFSTYMIQPAHTTTPMLSNIDSTKLSPTEWRLEAQPNSVVTDATLERHKYRLAEISRKTFDMFVAGNKSFSYGAILELDREYREIIETMPDAWITEHKDLEEKDPYLKSRRHGALQAVHNRIVRLHRPFFARGYTNPKFAYSTEACVRSAKIVLYCHRANISFRIKPMYSHSLSASIVLAADLFHHIDTGSSIPEIEAKKETLALALEIFSTETETRVQSKHLKAIIGQARRVLSGLFLEVEKRRARRMAKGARGGDEAGGKDEPFHEILARISRDVAPPAKPTSSIPVSSNNNNNNEIASSQALVPSSQPIPSSSSSYPNYGISDLMNPPSSSSNLYSTNSQSMSIPSSNFNGNFHSSPFSTTTTAQQTAPLPPATAPPPPDPFSAAFLSDLGLLDSHGQALNFYTNHHPPSSSSSSFDTNLNGNAGSLSSSSANFSPGRGIIGGGGGVSSGPSPTDSIDLSFLLGLTTDQGSQYNGQEASQALFNQLTGGF